MKPLCKWCKHRKYHHNLYPLDGTLCKGKTPFGCICSEYVSMDNLDYLEELYNNKVDKIKGNVKI